MRKNESLYTHTAKKEGSHLSIRSLAAAGIFTAALLVLLFALSPAFIAAEDEVTASWCETNAPADVSLAECMALEDLYNDTMGATDWTTKTNWLESTSVCTWYGVTCDAGNTQVTNLDLSINNLGGTLPSTLGTLTGLTYLDLGYNAITGPIPDSLGALTNLNIFYLDGNLLDGPVPTAVCNLSTPSFTVSYNMLEIDSACAVQHPGWAFTQTVPPLGVDVTSTSQSTVQETMETTASITIAWQPISYQDHGGGYQIFARNVNEGTPGVPFKLVSDKSSSTTTVDFVGDPMDFEFYIKTQTDPHNENPNTLVSAESEADSLGPVAVRMLDIEANTPLLYLPALAPLLLLLGTLVAVLILWRRNRAAQS